MFRILIRNRPMKGIRLFSTNGTGGFRPTIFALSTHLTRSAIGVIRVTGSHSQYIFNQLTKTNSEPNHRLSSLRKLRSGNGLILDEALTLYFKGPKSYTGEDMLELHVHGGVAIIKSVLKEIKHLHNPENDVHIRYAENGEFSHRAFLNGRFDLTELEGVREMIDAETESQRIAALSSVTGHNRRLFLQWRQEILNNIALLTTVIDFGEDHDVEEIATLFDVVAKNIGDVRKEIASFLDKVTRSEVLLKGIKIALLGPPNAGKSSLLNVLANEDAAIVSNIAGTTRDTIDIPLDINGYRVVVGDTAGVRDLHVADEIEIEGIRRAKQRSLQSDVALVVLPMGKEFDDLSDAFLQHVKELHASGVRIIGVLNKQDLGDNTVKQAYIKKFSEMIQSNEIYPVSCTNNTGTSDLIEKLTTVFKTVSQSENSDPINVSERTKDLLINDVLYGFDQFDNFKHQDDVVLATEGLRQSVDGIGKITGDAIGVEEILGVVFSSFCIGK